MKKNKNNKLNKQSKLTKSVNSHIKVAKGIYKQVSGTYAVRPVINGIRIHKTFTSLKLAKAFLNTIR